MTKTFEEIKAEDERLYAERCKAYEDFFGDTWQEIEDKYWCEDLTPEEVVKKFSDSISHRLEQCSHCNRYFWVDEQPHYHEDDLSAYYCPYCDSLGSWSDFDPSKRDAWY